MPEGPSILILKESVQSFKGKRVIKASGNAKIDMTRMDKQTIIDFKTWGKHFLICFKDFTVRIHLMMFGSYRVNEAKDAIPRLSLEFSNGVLNFYTCSVRIIEEDLNTIYDWEVDTLSDEWNPAKALASIKKLKKTMICDILLDQNIFAGSGNIVKNEVLFRIKVHPETMIGDMPLKKIKDLIAETRNYVFDFYNWKKEFELKKHFQVYTKKNCPTCGKILTKKHLGKGHRRTFFCEHCQVLYKK
jgi:endonuclease-8